MSHLDELLMGPSDDRRLAELFPDQKAREDAARVLERQAKPLVIVDRWSRWDIPDIPEDFDVEVVERAYFCCDFEERLGKSYFQISVAIGGAEHDDAGPPWPKYCYIHLFYSDGGELLAYRLTRHVP